MGDKLESSVPDARNDIKERKGNERKGPVLVKRNRRTKRGEGEGGGGGG